MNNNLNFNPELHNKTKRQWLMTYGTLMVTSMLFPIAAYFFKFNTKMNQASSGYFGLMMLFHILFTLAVFYLYYHCIYKKNGTKLLLINLIFIPASLAISFVAMKFGFSNPTLSETVFWMATLPLNAYLWYISYQLYQLNRAKKDSN